MEVLLVLAILVILGSMVTYYFVGAQKKAYARAAQSQIGMFERMMWAPIQQLLRAWKPFARLPPNWPMPTNGAGHM